MTAPPSAATAEITDESMRYHPISKVPIFDLGGAGLEREQQGRRSRTDLVDQFVEVIEARSGNRPHRQTRLGSRSKLFLSQVHPAVHARRSLMEDVMKIHIFCC